MKLYEDWNAFQEKAHQRIEHSKEFIEGLSKVEKNELPETFKKGNDLVQDVSTFLQGATENNPLLKDLHPIHTEFANLSFYGDTKEAKSPLRAEEARETCRRNIERTVELLQKHLKLLSIQDVNTGNIDQEEIEARKQLDTQGKEDLLLEKLYELDNDENHLLQPILEGNGVPLKSEKEVRELANDLLDEGYIDYPRSKDAPRAQINAKGRKKVEGSRKGQSQTYENVSEDGEELKRRIDEVLERVKMLELGQQAIYDDLDAELQKMKERIDQLDKTDWAQLLKAKLFDLTISAVITSEMAQEIFQAITDQTLALPTG